MKVNRIQWPTIKVAWELNKMTSAYILAEKHLINEDARNAIHAGPQEILDSHFDIAFGSSKDIQISRIERQLKELEETGRQLLEDEKYELMEEARAIYDALKLELDKLRNN